MPNVDQFESVFKAAAKPLYEHHPLVVRRVDVVTDLDAHGAGALAASVRGMLPTLAADVDWRAVPAEESRTVEQLLGLIERDSPDIVVTYRNLHSEAWQWPHSLGRHLDVLTQATECPVLVVPHPRERDPGAWPGLSCVMAATDHLAGDGRLVRYAAGLAPPGSRLVLAHVEDDVVFERYIETIGKIPAIDTDTARTAILAQLLKEPADYVEACRAALARSGLGLEVVGEVGTGHRIAEYRTLVDRHRVALLVMHTRDEEQLAMHGLAYPLAVELRALPLLMV